MPAKYPQFILLGDSLVEYSSYLQDGFCFGAALAKHCARRLEVVNRGLCGYNTAIELHILHELMPSPDEARVDYVLVLLGANDACLPDDASQQHIPVDSFKQNIRRIITHASITQHHPKILLVTPPPVHEVHLAADERPKGLKLSRHMDLTAQYAAAVREVAHDFQAQNVCLIDLWTALITAAKSVENSEDDDLQLGTLKLGYSEGLRQHLIDGLHLTGRGYEVFWNLLKPHVGTDWPHDPTDYSSWIFPHWRVAPS
ncbi:BgTH12-07787 [Blumeria graminis f. sp. triticale]|nr:BgTH12-07787 [Blumeria graminis f. sp. triticale]